MNNAFSYKKENTYDTNKKFELNNIPDGPIKKDFVRFINENYK